MTAGTALFSIDPTRERDGFSVATPEGTIRVTGTLFTVVIAEDGPVSVHLHKGTVALETPHAEATVMTAGHTAVLGDSGADIVSDTQSAEVPQQMRRLACMDDGALFSEFDGPLCTRDTATDPEATVSEPRPATRKSPATRTPSTTRPLAELLHTAREARMAGRHADAAVALRELIATYPDSADARTATVTLGQLELKKLGRPAEARRHFARYLNKPGSLAQDALVGQADACRAMRDIECERTTLERIIRDFPGGPADAAARRRLQDIPRQ
jgi:TolA-binding protein